MEKISNSGQHIGAEVVSHMYTHEQNEHRHQ